MRPTALLLAVLLALAPTAVADGPPPAKPADPLASMKPADRALLDRVLQGPTVVLPVERRMVKSSLAVYDQLVDRLDVTGRLVHGLALGTYRIERVDDQRTRIDDRAGAVAVVREVVRYEREGTHYRVYLADGTFKVPFIGKVAGDGVIRLGYKVTATGLDCTSHIHFRARRRAFHKLGHALRRILARVLKKKSTLFVRAAQQVSQIATAESARVCRLLRADAQLEKALAEQVAQVIESARRAGEE